MTLPEIPRTQQAWMSVQRGHPDHGLQLQSDVAVPKPRPGEVLIKVQAAALNPVGYKMMKLAPSWMIKRPYIAEHDFAGTVVDPNGTSFAVGDQVFGYFDFLKQIRSGKGGALAQYTQVPAEYLDIRPPNVTPAEAAGMTLAAQTAYQALLGLSKLESGQSVFINGGSTAVGLFAIQIAKNMGCKVAVSASKKNESLVRELGADEFFDYQEAPLTQTLIAHAPSPKYNVFLEAVGSIDPELFAQSVHYLAPSGVFVSVGPQPSLTLSGMATAARFIWKVALQPSWLGGTKRKWLRFFVEHDKDSQEAVRKLIEEGKLRPVVDSEYSFADARKAFERIMTQRATGKVVVRVEGP